MATPGFTPPFGAPSGPNTATLFEADIDPGARFLSRYLEGTRHIGALSPDQLPMLTLQECQTLSPGESVLIPLLGSTIHALNSIGLPRTNSTLGCTTWALRLQIPSLASRSETSVTPFLTCHGVWHPRPSTYTFLFSRPPTLQPHLRQA